MSNYQRHILTRWILSLLTVFVVVSSFLQISPITISERLPELGIYALLTAFALIFSVPLSQGRLSVAHAIGAIAFLSLPASVSPAMTIAIFVGGLVGSIIHLQIITSNETFSRSQQIAQIVYPTATVTLSFFLASVVYFQFFSGTVPISNAGNIVGDGVGITAYALTYAVLHLMGFALQVDDVSSTITPLTSENMLTLIVIMLLPLPFVLIGADVAQRDESFLFFTITEIGIALIISGLFVLTQSQRRWQQRVEEMRIIADMTRIMRRNIALRDLPQITHKQTRTLIAAQNFVFSLVDDLKTTTFPLVVSDDTVLDNTARPQNIALIDYIINTGQPLLLEESAYARAQEMTLSAAKTLNSWLGVPLISGNRVIGALAIAANDGKRFDEDDLRLLTIIADSTSIAVENARLYQEQQIRAEQLATLNQITTLLTGTLSPTEVLDMLISAASTLAAADGIGVFLYSGIGDEDSLLLARSAGMSEQFEKQPLLPIVANKTLPRNNLSNPTQLFVLNNLAEDDRTHLRKALHPLERENKHALIEVPLIIAKKHLGYLCLYYTKPQNFGSEELDLIRAFASQASQAIENARTFASTDEALEQRVEQLYALAAMGRLLNATLDPQQIYTVIHNYAVDATKAPRGALIMQSSDGLSVKQAQGFPPETFDNPSLLLQGLIGRVLNTGQAARTGDIRLETGYLPLVPHTRSMLIVPLLKGRDVLGAILLESDKPHAFSEGDGHFVAQIANQAVIAIENTQLFQRVRAALDNMTVMLGAMEEGIILIDTQGKVAQANSRINLVSINKEDILHQPVRDLLNDDTLQLAKRLGFANKEDILTLLRQMHTPHAFDDYPPHRYEIHSPEFGVRYMQRQIIPVEDENNQIIGILLVFYNKSEEHELMQARTAFSEMIVHDLRSPLTAVTTSIALLDTIIPEDSPHYPIVQKTTNASTRAVRTVLARVDSLLDMSKMESGEMTLDREPTVLHILVNNVFLQINPLAQESNVSLAMTIPEHLPLLNVDADKIERLILNLVDNALKYTPPHSEVTVSATVHNSEFAVISVADMGPGIPNDYKKRLFDRFVQVEGRKTVRRGVGLGLTFCKLAVEAHDGAIWVEDNQPQGSIFKATLPIVPINESSR